MIRTILGICFIPLVITLASCGRKNAGDVESKRYKLFEIDKKDVTLTNTYSASIRGRQDIKIIPRVDGYLTDVLISEGSKVKKGQSLFIIDQTSYKAALNAAKANVAICEASVETAQLTLSSKQNLYDKKIVSDFELISAKNSLKTAKAQLEQAKAQETAALNNLSYTVIKSPSDGVVGSLPYRVGDYVSSAISDGLTIVADNSQMYVYFSMSERQMLDIIQQYQTIDLAIRSMPEVQLYLSNQTIYPQKGRIESISGVVDASTGAINIRAVFPNKEGSLLSGGAGSVIVPYIHHQAIIIPQEATFEIQDKTYVYKVVDSKAVSTIITVDKINDGKEYVVTTGLNTGDIIIAEGAGLVQEGTKVNVENNIK